MTTITLDQVREACGITKYTIPEHLYRDVIYDKWGNVCQTKGTRLKGDLFNDPSVQKILGMGGVLGIFIDRVKYPRTYHSPWSPGATSDDRILPNMENFIGRRVIVTEKRWMVKIHQWDLIISTLVLWIVQFIQVGT
jgi:hypothetical protein